jgi:methyl-accepting chemotaxis protein
LDRLSRSLQKTGKELYQRACDALKADALGGRLEPVRYTAARQTQWPAPVRSFFDSADAERFLRSGRDGDHIEYLVRRGDAVWQWSTSLGGVALDQLSREYSNARAIVEKRQSRDLLRGFTYTYVLLAASVWIASLVLLVYLAHRISRPIQQLTAGLAQFAAGDLATRVEARGDDEIGRAMRAFNDMAERLQRSTARLVYLTQLASCAPWRAKWRTRSRIP